MASLQDYQHTVARVLGYHNNKGRGVGWWECDIPSTASTCALTGWQASKCCPFMIEILLSTDKVLIAEKNWGLNSRRYTKRQETIDGSPGGIPGVLLPSAMAVAPNRVLKRYRHVLRPPVRLISGKAIALYGRPLDRLSWRGEMRVRVNFFFSIISNKLSPRMMQTPSG
jgi:hypothetical protein